MSDIYGTEEELQGNVRNRIREYFQAYPVILREEEGIELISQDGLEFPLPFPNIFTKSISLSVHDGDYFLKENLDGNRKSAFVFKHPQDHRLKLGPFHRRSVLVLANEEEAPKDFNKYFSYYDAVKVPILIPIINMDHADVEAAGMMVRVSAPGSIALYCAREPEWIDSARKVMSEIQGYVEQSSSVALTHGIESFNLDKAEERSFPDFMEISAPFTTRVLVNTQNDHYW